MMIKIMQYKALFPCINSCSRWNRFLSVNKPNVVSMHSSQLWHNKLMVNNRMLKICPSTRDKGFLAVGIPHELATSRHLSQHQQAKDKSLGAKLIELAPHRVQPYLELTRIDKPTGTLLLLWPAFWSICLAAEAGCWPSGYYLSLFALGTFLMRGAGCIINDMWDKDIDSKVQRTRLRPLASGRLDFTDALAFLGVQLSCASIVLLQLDWFSILLGFSSMALVVTYPLAKRYTNWPQLVLGFTFNWGAVMGWSAVHGAFDWLQLLPLYAAAISWTLVYDTIYAHQDKEDDAKLGIKSTALSFEDNTKKWLSVFSCSMLANLLLTGAINSQTWPFYASVGLVGLHLAAQITTLNTSNPENCAKRFKSNATLGLILFVGIISSNLLKQKNSRKNEALQDM